MWDATGFLTASILSFFGFSRYPRGRRGVFESVSASQHAFFGRCRWLGGQGRAGALAYV